VQRSTRRPALALAVIVAGYAALIAAWMVANPLGRAPDEPGHYLRALGAVSENVKGRRIQVPGADRDPKRRWVQGISRQFVLPSRLSIDPDSPCGTSLFDPEVSAACQPGWPAHGPPVVVSTLGSYQPYTYAPIGAAMSAAHSPTVAFRLGRGAVALAAVVLIGLAALTLLGSGDGRRRAHPAGVAAFAIAVPPMAVFLASSLNPNGLEIAAGVACAAGLFSLLRSGRDAEAPRGAWLTFGAGGVVLAATRSLGPYFVVALLAVAVVWVGLRAAGRVVLRAPIASAAALGCIGATAVLNLWWEATQQPHLQWSHVLDHLSVERVPRIGQELVGRFGWLEWRLSVYFYAAWGVLVLVLVVLALARGTGRQRLALGGLIAGAFVLIIAFHSVMPGQTGFDVQGRYLLPLIVAVPVLAGEILRSRRLPAVPMAAAVGACGVVVAGLQFFAWYENARRYAVGTSGPRWFVGHALWVPAGGWILWMTVAAAGCVFIAAGVVLAVAPAALLRSERLTVAAAEPHSGHGAGALGDGDLARERAVEGAAAHADA